MCVLCAQLKHLLDPIILKTRLYHYYYYATEVIRCDFSKQNIPISESSHIPYKHATLETGSKGHERTHKYEVKQEYSIIELASPFPT